MRPEDLKLDIHDLDSAILNQAELYYQVGIEWAEAVAERDSLKDQITLKKAEIDEEVRKDPYKFGLSDGQKTTETWFANRVISHPEIVSLNERYLQACKNVDILSVGKSAFEHRLKATTMLVDLYKGNYFVASNTVSQEETAKEVANEKQREDIENHPRMQKRILKRKEGN